MRFLRRRRRTPQIPIVCGPCGARFDTVLGLQLHAQLCWRPTVAVSGDRPWDLVRPAFTDPRPTR